MAHETQTSSAASPTDNTVVTLHPIDERAPVGLTRTLVFFVVRHVLNQAALREALEKLIRNHLPILAARYQPATGKGGLGEYHHPKVYPDNATLFAWSQEAVHSPLEASGLLPDVSAPKAAVVWGKPITDLEAAWTPLEWPRSRKDDKPDTPLLLVHITNYDDATVLSVNIPHAIADQKGLASMVEAWLALVRGDQPIPFIQLEPGALDGPKDLADKIIRKKGQYRLKTKGEHIRVILGVVPDLILNRAEDRRMLFLSAETVASLRDRCNSELKEKYGNGGASLTNGDLVTSILVKLAYLYRKKPKNFVLGETVNARGRHPSLPSEKPYLHNCPAYACARFKLSRTTPLSEIARHHRLSIIETSKLENIERSFAVTKRVFQGDGYVFPSGEPGDLTFHVTNWTSAWYNVDFTPASMSKEIPSPEITASRSPILVFGHATLRDNDIHRLHAPIMCKGDGGYWVDFSCSLKNMALVEDLLRKDPYLSTL